MRYTTEIIGILFSAVIVLILWQLLLIPWGLVTALIVGILFFLMYENLSSTRELTWSLPSIGLERELVSVSVIISVIAVLFGGQTTAPNMFISWETITWLSLVELAASLFLTVFFPGFLILDILSGWRKLGWIERILFSVLISLFILPFLGCLSFTLGMSILSTDTFTIAGLNLVLLVPYFLIRREATGRSIKKIDLKEKSVLILLMVFILVLFISKYSTNLLWEFNDQDNYFGYAVAFTKGNLPISPIGPGLTYPFWSSIAWAQYFVLAGVPYANAFQVLLVPLSFLPVLSFYVMASAFFGKSRYRELPIIATFLSFLGGGFGLIFGLQKLVGAQTANGVFALFDTMMRSNSGYLDPAFYSTGMQFIFFSYILSLIFSLIWLIYSPHGFEIGGIRYFLISALIALGFLSHTGEIPIFLVIFLMSLLVLKPQSMSSYRKCAVAILLGLAVVILPDIMLGGSYYTRGIPLLSDQAPYPSFLYSILTLYVASVVLTLTALLLSFARGHVRLPKTEFKVSPNTRRALKVVLVFAFFYFCVLSLVIWGEAFKTYNYLPMENHTVPWYGWVNRFGLCGIIVLGGMGWILSGIDVKKHIFFPFLILSSFIIAGVIHVYPLYYEDRLTFFMMIPILIAAAYVLLRLIGAIKSRFGSRISRLLFGSILLLLILGMVPYLLSVEAMDLDYWSQGQKLSQYELDALNFLRINVPSNCSVLTLSVRSEWYMYYAGLSPAQTFYLDKDNSIIFNPLSPQTLLYSLVKSQVKYLYLTSADEQELNKNQIYGGLFRDYLLPYLPIAFQNEEVTIYEIPEFISSQSQASTSFVMDTPIVGYSKDTFDIEQDFKYLHFCTVLTAGDIATLRTDNQSRPHYLEIVLHLNPNEFPLVRIRWKTSGSTLLFGIGTNKTVYYTLLGDSTDWQESTVSLSQFYDIQRGEMMHVGQDEQITSVIFAMDDPNAEFSLDYFEFLGIPNTAYVNSLYSLSAVDLAGVKYELYQTDDPNRLAFPTIILSNDLSLSNEFEREQFQDYMNSVDHGKELIVMASNEAFFAYANETSNIGAFAHELGLNLKGVDAKADGIKSLNGSVTFPETVTVPVINSNDSESEIIANFTLGQNSVSPYAFVKHVGEGKIVYLFVSPYFSAVKDSESLTGSTLFMNSGSLLNVLDLNMTLARLNWSNYIPQFDYAEGPVELKGEITVSTDYFQFSKLGIKSATVFSQGQETNTLYTNDSFAERLNYETPIQFEISATEARFGRNITGPYLDMNILGDFNLTMEIPQGGAVNLTIQNNGLRNETFAGDKVVITFADDPEQALHVRDPSIDVNGLTFFNKARIYRSNYSAPLWYDDGTKSFEIIGNTRFVVEYADNGVYFLSSCNFNGTWSHPSSGEISPSLIEYNIPWAKVLTSPLNVGTIVLCIVACLFLSGFKRNKSFSARFN